MNTTCRAGGLVPPVAHEVQECYAFQTTMESIDVERCIEGDEGAWNSFVTRFMPVVCSAVRKTIGGCAPDHDHSFIEDAVQEVFVHIIENDFRALRSYDPCRASLVTWLTVVARNVAIDHVRRSVRHAEQQLIDVPEPSSTPASAAELPAGLLSARQRLVLHLLYDMDMDVAEVAVLLRVDQQTVRSTKHKAIVRLREQHARRV